MSYAQAVKRFFDHWTTSSVTYGADIVVVGKSVETALEKLLADVRREAVSQCAKECAAVAADSKWSDHQDVAEECEARCLALLHPTPSEGEERPLTGAELAEKHGFKPHGRDPLTGAVLPRQGADK